MVVILERFETVALVVQVEAVVHVAHVQSEVLVVRVDTAVNVVHDERVGPDLAAAPVSSFFVAREGEFVFAFRSAFERGKKKKEKERDKRQNISSSIDRTTRRGRSSVARLGEFYILGKF